MQEQSLHYPYSSTRNVAVAKHGMVATSQPLAADAGLEMLKQGGNAVDAAIATAAALTVVEPTSNGIGGDAFAIIRYDGALYGVNGSGKSPASLSKSALQGNGPNAMPRFGVLPITTPGAVKAWGEISERFGSLDFATLLGPAIRHAKEGYALSPTLAQSWARALKAYKTHFTGAVFTPFFETFAKDNATPMPGDVVYLKDHARTLQAIADTKGETMYKGPLAQTIAEFIQAHGGYLSTDDLANHSTQWVEPLYMNYKGVNVYELPPNGQGMIALSSLGMLQGDEIGDDPQSLHLQIEALKRAFSDGNAYIGDPQKMNTDHSELLKESYLLSRRRSITAHAQIPKHGTPSASGTVYLSTADAQGNAVSFIQSNYMGFGSGVVIPGTGIAMQNRGHGFSMTPGHPNEVAGNKRPYHTIIPGYLEKPGEYEGPFGVMGGFMQPQGHLQVISSLVDNGLNPQSALDKPRWHWVKDTHVQVEQAMPSATVQALMRRGHKVEVLGDPSVFGRGQIILRLKSGVLIGGTEKRTDGAISLH